MNDEIRKYQKRVIEILQRDYFPEKENWLIMEQPVMKNNSTRLDGVVIRKPYQRVSPTYYINGYYADGYTEEATAQAIYESYTKEQIEETVLRLIQGWYKKRQQSHER